MTDLKNAHDIEWNLDFVTYDGPTQLNSSQELIPPVFSIIRLMMRRPRTPLRASTVGGFPQQKHGQQQHYKCEIQVDKYTTYCK